MRTREELETALDALEAQREVLGDAAVEAAQAQLRRELAQVLAAARAATGPDATVEGDGNGTPPPTDAYGHPWIPGAASRGPQDYHGDHRPNTGMHEGEIPHAEVNAAIRAADKVILFGQQTRLRARRLMDDERLRRIHPGHRLSKFFYGGVRQLPERLLDALLAKKVSVTMIRGLDLLVFHDRRRHQAFHAGRTRRTVYIPEPILEQAYQMGYDYWAIAEILIQESWPLLDYILLLEMIERCQLEYRERSTLGYRFMREGLRSRNKHMRDLTDHYRHMEAGLRKGDEMGVFLEHYLPRLFALKRDIVDRDPYDVTDEVYDFEWERFGGRAKLSEVATINSFPTYFMIDRDVVHPAAFERAAQLDQPAEPQTPEEVVHDLGDETRFKTSLSLRTEELLERLIEMSAPGIRAFLRATSARLTHTDDGGPPVELDRHGMVGEFRRRLQGYSGSGLSEVPGSVAYDLRQLQDYYRSDRRSAWIRQLQDLPNSALGAQAHGIRQTLSAIVDQVVRRDQARELKRQITRERNLRGLVDTVAQVAQPASPEVEREHLVGLLYKLDQHPLYSERFLPDATALNGGVAPGPPSIRPEVERLRGYMHERFFEMTSDPGELGWFMAQFRDTDETDPYNRLLFTWIAGVLIRQDRDPDFAEICIQVALLGEYAVPALEDIARSPTYYGSDGRGRILKGAEAVLPKLPAADPELRREWDAEVARRRGLEPADTGAAR